MNRGLSISCGWSLEYAIRGEPIRTERD